MAGRLGSADREPGVELSLARTTLRQTIALTAYNRLVPANDWGSPLGFGASVSNFLFGRDEGFCYRATGAELLRWATERGASLDWRLFGEQERAATQRTEFSSGGTFVPNIVAAPGSYTGAAVRWQHEHGAERRRVAARARTPHSVATPSGRRAWSSARPIGYRLTVFGDLGWVGDRSAVADLVRPMRAAGVRLSMVDGLVRFDVARGYYPRRQTRF